MDLIDIVSFYYILIFVEIVDGLHIQSCSWDDDACTFYDGIDQVTHQLISPFNIMLKLFYFGISNLLFP